MIIIAVNCQQATYRYDSVTDSYSTLDAGSGYSSHKIALRDKE